MNCPYCGHAVTCAACGAAIEEPARPEVVISDDGWSWTAPPPEPAKPPDRTFLIVARGHGDLLDQLREVVGDLGWVRLMEDRRTGETILPREGRGGTVHVDRDITP
ncbi:MAG: hypothetical protein ACREMB_27735 [Candidatus Rokuibacteriota bacterium]